MATKNNARQRPLIHCLSDEELVAELNRRKQEIEERAIVSKNRHIRDEMNAF